MSSKLQLRLCLLGLLPLFIACSSSSNHNDGGVDSGVHPAPIITMTEPNNAQRNAVYNFNVLGNNFFGDVHVFLGGVEATNVTVISPLRISAKTVVTPTPGAVDVKVVNGDGQTATLPNGFTFLDPIQVVRTIDNCLIQYPKRIVSSDGGTQVVYGHVLGANLTNVTGPVAGLVGQLGLGAPGTAVTGWKWMDAAYNDACTTCNDTSKEFMATLAPPAAAGTYDYAYRFNFDGGAFTYCDQNGIWDGGASGTPGTLTVGAAGSSAITACNLQYPFAIDAGTGTLSPVVYGHVTAPGFTDGPGAPSAVTGQLGFGPGGTDPNTWSSWGSTMFNAACTTCKTGEAEFQGTFNLPPPGAYNYTYRFQVSGGAFTYCDANGMTAGTNTGAALGQLLSTGQAITSCQLLTNSITGQPSQAAAPAAVGTVTIPGLTGSGSSKPSIVGQAGYGPAGSHPDNTWTWTPAAFSRSPDGGSEDDYTATVTAPAATGDYSLAYRFSFNDGGYVYCGLNGGTAYTQGGSLHVPSSSHCALQALSSATAASGDPLTTTASIVIPGATGGTSAAPGVLTQVGIGNGGSSASADPSWGWMNATYQGRGAAGDDLYTATFHPSITGARTVDYRFSTDNGKTWTYCDTSGAGDGALTVGNVDNNRYCNLQYPQAVSDAGTLIYGQIYVNNLTAGGDAGAITAQLIYGPMATDPDLTWTAVNAASNGSKGSNIEYVAPFPLLPAGTYGYAFRYMVNGENKFCYGQWVDSGGSTMGFLPANFGVATVVDAGTP